MAWRVCAEGNAAGYRQKLSEALKAALKDPELVKRFNDIKTEPMSEGRATPEAAALAVVPTLQLAGRRASIVASAARPAAVMLKRAGCR